MSHIQIKRCVGDDFDKIKNLLNYYKLITQDIDFNKQLFYKLMKNGDLVAIGGLELYSPNALVRSVAVKPDKIRHGYASQIYAKLEQAAQSNHISELFLLTETAESFFAKLGFQSIDRRLAPVQIKNTNQFSSLCPDDAVLMKKSIIPST